MYNVIVFFWVTALSALSTTGCVGSNQKPVADGVTHLQDCPDRPNCVSSNAVDEKHHIKPLELKGDVPTGWKAIKAAVNDLPRTKIVASRDSYIHAECKSRFFRFVDDLELQLDKKTGIIAIRSASRIGYFDFGVNRRRVEALRALLIKYSLID